MATIQIEDLIVDGRVHVSIANVPPGDAIRDAKLTLRSPRGVVEAAGEISDDGRETRVAVVKFALAKPLLDAEYVYEVEVRTAQGATFIPETGTLRTEKKPPAGKTSPAASI